jgi:hypothetical protein
MVTDDARLSSLDQIAKTRGTFEIVGEGAHNRPEYVFRGYDCSVLRCRNPDDRAIRMMHYSLHKCSAPASCDRVLYATKRMLGSVIATVATFVFLSPAHAQPAYRGLMIGTASKQNVLSTLGPSPIRTGHTDDLRYPVPGSDTLNDRLYFRGDKLALVTAASADPRYPNRRAIEDALGTPEAQVFFRTQQYLDYTEHGLKFVCAADGATTGRLC